MQPAQPNLDGPVRFRWNHRGHIWSPRSRSNMISQVGPSSRQPRQIEISLCCQGPLSYFRTSWTSMAHHVKTRGLRPSSGYILGHHLGHFPIRFSCQYLQTYFTLLGTQIRANQRVYLSSQSFLGVDGLTLK